MLLAEALRRLSSYFPPDYFAMLQEVRCKPHEKELTAAGVLTKILPEKEQNLCFDKGKQYCFLFSWAVYLILRLPASFLLTSQRA